MKRDVHVLVVGNMDHQSPDAKAMYGSLLGLDIKVDYALTAEDLPEYEDEDPCLLVDALFGIGCTRPLTGVYEAVVEWINAMGSRVISVDIPSGINSDKGHVMGIAVRADVTVTFTVPKPGLLVGHGKEAAGSLYVVDIGIPEAVLQEFTFKYELIDHNILDYLPKRPEQSHKMSFGRLLIIAGSESMSGAGILASKAAYRAGGGLVEVITHQNGLTSIQEAIPEAIVHTYDKPAQGYEILRKISKRLTGFDGILIGPGLSTSDLAKDMMTGILEQGRCPLVIDADGLNLLPSLLPLVENYKNKVILTPHIGEMSRMTGHSSSDILNDPFAYAEAYSKAHGVITVLKSNTTVISDGSDRFCINGMGNQGMATAGSGDVLAGIILAMIGQGAKPYMAAALGVGLHSYAADWMVGRIDRVDGQKALGERSLIASDIIEGLGMVLKNR